MAVDVIITDNFDEVKDQLTNAVTQALAEVGIEAQTRAAENAPKRTGTLAGSYSSRVVEDEKCVYVGALSEAFPEKPYAAYVELGTSRTRAQPHLKPAIMDNIDVYRNIIDSHMKG